MTSGLKPRRTDYGLPRLPVTALPRPRLFARLQNALEHPLTLVVAGSGYGKTTLLATYFRSRRERLVYWALTADEQDRAVFVQGLRDALSALGEEPGLLDGRFTPRRREGQRHHRYLILDDFHLASSQESVRVLEYFLEVLPAHVHLVVSGRSRPALTGLARLILDGRARVISAPELAFTAEETRDLWTTLRNEDPPPGAISRLLEITRGWPAAVVLALSSGAPAPDSGLVWEDLYSQLAREALGRMPAALDFLLEAAALPVLSPQALADAGINVPNPDLLFELVQLGFAIPEDVPDTFRLHPLFHEFLQRMARQDGDRWRATHARALGAALARGDHEAAVDHALEAGRYEDAATLLVGLAAGMISAGRLRAFERRLAALPPAVLGREPRLLEAAGDVERLLSRFESAAAWYQQAERQYAAAGDNRGRIRTLVGLARIYLDTVAPAQARPFLHQAFRLVSEPGATTAGAAELLPLHAENLVNTGFPAAAASVYRNWLVNGGTGDPLLEARIMLRSGRLEQARQLLAAHVEPRERPPRAHRENALVLSYVLSLMGEGERAAGLAQEGRLVGIHSGSRFVEVVADMREGHACCVSNDLDRAEMLYRRALRSSQELAALRAPAEALMGLCLLEARRGRAAEALAFGREALYLLERSGDAWLATWTKVAMGTALARQQGGSSLLAEAESWFRNRGDPYGATVSSYWLSVASRDHPHLERAAAGRFAQGVNHGYHFLLERGALFGPWEPHAALAVWERGRDRPLAPSPIVPERGLCVHALGGLDVWVDGAPVAGRWVRASSRSLLLYLILAQGPVPREVLADALWPDAEGDAALNLFKVALHGLLQTLEPARPPRAPSRFIRRQGNLYSISPDVPVYTDLAAFGDALERASREARDQTEMLALLRHALSLYRGDLAPELGDPPWLIGRRATLRRQFLEAAEVAGELEISCGHPANARDLARRMLDLDPLCEGGYRLAMRYEAFLGNLAAAGEIYHACTSNLARAGLRPSPRTTATWEAVKKGMLLPPAPAGWTTALS